MLKHAPAVIVGLALGVTVSAILLLAFDERSGPAIVIDDPAAVGTIVVDVAGAVVSPGVVALGAGARLNDAMAEAGGPAPDADLARMNPARRLQDGEQIVVPRLGEVVAAVVSPTVETSASADGGAGSGVGAEPSATAAVAQVSSAGLDEPININTANASDLETLPEIGPARAQAIMAYRTQHGAFRSVDELANVPSISQRMVDQMRHLISVGP